MCTDDKINRVKTLIGNDPEATDAVIMIYLSDAESAILNRLYPFGIPEDAKLPSEYDNLHCRLALRYYAKRGGEGESTHNENGINRSFASADDNDLLSVVTPYVKL